MFGLHMGRMGGVGGVSLAAQIAALFASGEQGVWYDPSDFGTLFQDSAGTTQVTAVGQPVGKMLDKSGRGNHATQPTAINRPVLQQDANQKYYLAFNGTNSWMSTAAFATPIAQPVSYFIGRTWDSITADPRHIFDGDATNRQFFVGSAANEYLHAGLKVAIIAPTAAVPNVISLLANGASSFVRKNGVQTNGDVGTGAMGVLYLGSNYLNSNYGNFRLYSFIMRGAASSDAQLASAEAYANSKTGAY